ncbi:SDR family NAD(P)-dependent oxidoreductase [Enemella sp. A6]|uniref:SDR family NAD(P)-dependent oxidoreductase n=1 Tax=Enemella sp. A6 TaxID=3440152 RepID=UPI003EBBE1A8
MTGASRGIGRATAVEFAKAGFDVAITARTVREGEGSVKARTGSEVLPVAGSLESARAEILDHGARVASIRMDLLNLDEVEAVADRVIAELGRIDVCVNNAYAQTEGNMDRLADISLGDAEAMWRGNFLHQLALTRTVIPHLVRRGGGTFINIVSGSAYADPPAAAGAGGWGLSYAASKAAFGRLAGVVNAEYRTHGVQAFNLDPGFVITESGLARGGTDKVSAHTATNSPTVPARAAVWLATAPEAARFLGRRVRSVRLIGSLDAGETPEP